MQSKVVLKSYKAFHHPKEFIDERMTQIDKRHADGEALTEDVVIHENRCITESSEKRLTKRCRFSDIVPVDSRAVTIKSATDRTSKLLAPTMLLSGHDAAVYSVKIDPSGMHVASASFDQRIRTLFIRFISI